MQKYKLEHLPQEIERITQDIARIEQKMADPEFFMRDPDGFAQAANQLSLLKSEREQIENEWLELELIREELDS